MKESFVYLLASQKHGTLYLGVASNLIRRVYEHREGLAAGFTAAYGVRSLVWYEVHGDIREAIRREKQIKKWKRQWKIRLIEEMNPEWKDLYDELV